MMPSEKPSPLIRITPQIVIAALSLAIVALVILIAALAFSSSDEDEAAQDSPIPTAVIGNQGSPPPAVPQTATAPSAAGSGQIVEIPHVVRSGDTPTSIAFLYGVGLEDLLTYNNLTDQRLIQAGQVILVPMPVERSGLYHEVRIGEGLYQIAERYSVPPELVQAANNITDVNAIYVGQLLLIPGIDPSGGSQNPAPDVTATLSRSQEVMADRGAGLIDWPRSIFEGDLATNYPLSYAAARFTIHYQPGSYTEANLEKAVDLTETALARVEEVMGVTLTGGFNVYLAGTLFESPGGGGAQLRGLSLSEDRNVFILFDGTGDEAENLYLLTHELTHLVAWNIWGRPRSTMLSEGLATYAGQQALEAGDYLPYKQVCLAAYATGEMGSMALLDRDWQQFQGHNRHRLNYFGSACFVSYLIETYGLEPMSHLYGTSDYPLHYGTSLPSLDTEWRSAMEADLDDLRVNPDELILYTAEVAEASDYVFKAYDGTPRMHQAYIALDQARLALWRGEYDQVRSWLNEVYTITGWNPATSSNQAGG